MNLRVADNSDDDRLVEFFSELTLPGPFDMRIMRPKSFFSQYKLQSNEFETFILEDEGRILACATVVYREAYFESKKHRTAIMTDLRLAPVRKSVVGWQTLLLPKLEEIRKTKNVLHLLTSIPRSEGRGLTSLIRPRAAPKGTSTFHQVTPFEVAAVLGRSPLALKPLKTLRMIQAGKRDLEELVDYLARRSTKRPMAFPYLMDALVERLERWPGLSLSDFLIARTKQGEIVGCVAPWNPSAVQGIFPQRYHSFSSTLKTALKLGSFLGYTAKFPDIGNKLDLCYLTHFRADNPDIFYTLLYMCMESARPRRLMLYTHFPRWPLTIPPRGLYTATLPMSLYAMVPYGETLPPYLKESNLLAPPDIEPSLI